MDAEPASVELDPDQTGTVQVTLENDGSRSGAATLSVDGPDEGWSGELSETEVTVPAGGSETVTLNLGAPAERSQAANDRTVTVSGTITDDTGQFSASDQTEVGASMTPAPPPPDPFPWVEVVGTSVAAIGVVAAGAVGWFLRRRETGIEIEAAPGTDVRPGSEAYIPVEVLNTSARPRRAQLHVGSLPSRWGGGINRDEVDLDAGEKASLWLAVKPPATAEEGTYRIELVAKPAEARFSEERVRAEVEVVDDARDPDNPSRTLVAPIGVRSPDPYEDHQVLDDDYSASG